mmetsp:Transcript_9526/g.13316  ORF Transcript_9526/g.13316 Transcript_9526/m.13316 type:complete len:278 (+) Transcript_9526:263-1096(+)|eukprot:CAMPEP_0184488792 /NCGR_PEP_ID=MMETSP0113_2-20130426/13473_1 /TAXON_ID=91329 /ORGANISM="Norrisiella sphaerica, Strain BC52" /LENGTH=277 /DNA_ID=CAMNT_0026871827 /DNA_START=213 /DNA_END=1046 /DNA_ORIENTATION=-
MQRVFICDKKSTCPLFDYTWDWGVDAKPSDISSLVCLFFQFSRSVDEVEAKENGDSKLSTSRTKSKTENSLTGTRETLRVVFEPPIPQRNSRRLERIMRYANNINALASRTSRLKASRSDKHQLSVAMVTAANEKVRVAVFCDALFNVELSRQITEQILQRFANQYTSLLKTLEPSFTEEAKDQNEARTHLKYMQHFREFVGPLNQIVEKHPKSNIFSQQTDQTMTSEGTRQDSRFDEEDKSGRGEIGPLNYNQDTVKREKKATSILQKKALSPRMP